MRRFALPLLLLLALAAATPAAAGGALGPRATALDCGTTATTVAAVTAADILRLGASRYRRGGTQLACSSGCRRRCRSVYNRCRSRTRDWRRCSSVLRSCLRSCGC